MIRRGILFFTVLFGLLITASAQQSQGRLLVWVGQGVSAEMRTGSTPSQVAYLNADGTLETLVELDGSFIGAAPCGDTATSPDNQHFMFYVNAPGGSVDAATLYQITGDSAPVQVATTTARTCAGSGTLQYSPNSTRFGFIDYPGNLRTEYTLGTLQIFQVSNFENPVTESNVAAFHLVDNAAVWVNFFTNNQGEVNQAVITRLEGTARTEMMRLTPDVTCRFTSAQISPILEGQYAVVMGQRCQEVGGTQWQFYLINPTADLATLIVSDTAGGPFAPAASTNLLLPALNNAQVWFTVPDGLIPRTTRVLLSDLHPLTEAQTVVQEGAVMPLYTASDFTVNENAVPVFSADRRYWAMVVSSNRDTPSIAVIDRQNPSSPPVTIAADNRQDSIPFVGFSPDNSRLYYVTGASASRGGNVLYQANVTTGEKQVVSRGRYSTGVVTPNGVVLTAWDATARDPFTRLVSIAPDGTSTTLYEDYEAAADGNITRQMFVYPMAWR